MKNIFILFISLSLCNQLIAQDNSANLQLLLNSTVTIKSSNGGITKQGSGFFIDKNIIVTNYHVIKNATNAVCFIEDPSHPYKIEGSLSEDESTDLILLKVAQLDRPAIKIAEEAAVKGQTINIIGRPMGSSVISEGTISALKETDGIKQLVINSYATADNSGGPVLNTKGELIGISLGSKEGLKVQLAVSKESLVELINAKSDTVLTLADLNASDQNITSDPAADLPKDAQVNVNTIDFKNNILPNEIIIFKSKHTNNEYQGLTDSTGQFSLRLPAGDDYDIFILGFKDSTSYNVLKIPALGKNEFYKKSFKVEVKFQPPLTFVLDDCNFNSGKSTLMPESFPVLDELVKYLNRKDDDRIEIGGHTDNVGQLATNLKLSLDRANVVRDYLLLKGIDPNRVTAKGYGSTKSVADNKTEDGRATNRRTEVTILQ